MAPSYTDARSRDISKPQQALAASTSITPRFQ
jgi:hypothetical protein